MLAMLVVIAVAVVVAVAIAVVDVQVGVRIFEWPAKNSPGRIQLVAARTEDVGAPLITDNNYHYGQLVALHLFPSGRPRHFLPGAAGAVAGRQARKKLAWKRHLFERHGRPASL